MSVVHSKLIRLTLKEENVIETKKDVKDRIELQRHPSSCKYIHCYYSGKLSKQSS